MIPLFFLFDFLNSLTHFQLALLGAVPLLLAVVIVLMNIFLRRKETVGFVYNGSILMMVYFFVYLGSVFAQYAAKWLPKSWHIDSPFETAVNQEGIHDNSVLWYIFTITLLYFVCFFIIAIRPLTEEQMQKARKEEQTVIEFTPKAGSKAIFDIFVNILTVVGTFLSFVLQLFIHSLFILLSGFLGAMFLGIILLPILGGFAIFGTLFLMFASIVIMWVICAWKFLKNALIIAIGPAKAGYKLESE